MKPYGFCIRDYPGCDRQVSSLSIFRSISTWLLLRHWLCIGQAGHARKEARNIFPETAQQTRRPPCKFGAVILLCFVGSGGNNILGLIFNDASAECTAHPGPRYYLGVIPVMPITAWREGSLLKISRIRHFLNSGNLYYRRSGAIFLLTLPGNCFPGLDQILPIYANCYSIHGYWHYCHQTKNVLIFDWCCLLLHLC